MSPNWVPWVPSAGTVPYQKGAGALVKWASSNRFVAPVQARVSGKEASLVPRNRRQVDPVGNSGAAWADSNDPSSRQRPTREIIAVLYHRPDRRGSTILEPPAAPASGPAASF